MKLAHNAAISVFCKPDEDAGKIRGAMVSLFPFDLEKEKISIGEQNAVSFNEKQIKIFEVRLKKDSQTSLFLRALRERLGKEQNRRIAIEANSRIDDDLYFFIRLEKDKLVQNGEYSLTEGGNCFHIKISLAAFPKKKERGVELVEGFFGKTG